MDPELGGRDLAHARMRRVALALGVCLVILTLGVPGVSPSRDPIAACGTSDLVGTCHAAIPASNATPSVATEVWYNVSDSSAFNPRPSANSSMAYDPADSYLVLFGGCTPMACPAPSQTWSYSGGSWTNRTGLSPQPSPRWGAQMEFDSKDNYVLLFGGHGPGSQILNDTWEFSAGRWTNISANLTMAPPGRWGGSVVYDHSDFYLVLFGGCGVAQCPLNDTWRYATGSWLNLSSLTAPPARDRAVMAWDDPVPYVMLAFGCGATQCPLSDDWTFLHGKWTKLTPKGGTPTPRYSAVATYSSTDSAVIVYGGLSAGGSLADTWKFAAGTWTNLTSSVGAPPTPRGAIAAPPGLLGWVGGTAKRWPYTFAYGGDEGGTRLQNDSWVLEALLSASVTAVPGSAEVAEPINFAAAAQGGSAPYVFRWTLGDGTVVPTANASHAYGATGNYTAAVNVTDSAGVTARSTTTVSVVPGPTVTRISPNPGATDVGFGVHLVATVAGGTSPNAYRWSFGDGTSSTAVSPSHAYGVVGNFTVNLTVTDAVAGQGTGTVPVRVNPLPSIRFTVTPPSPTLGNASYFSASINGGTGPYILLWSFGDGQTSLAAAPQHLYKSIGTYNVTVALTDSVGATSTDSTVLSILAPSNPVLTPKNSEPFWQTLWFDIVLSAGAIAGAIAGVVWVIRNRRRDKPPPPISVAAAGHPEWFDEGAPDRRSVRRQRRMGR